MLRYYAILNLPVTMANFPNNCTAIVWVGKTKVKTFSLVTDKTTVVAVDTQVVKISKQLN